MIRVGEVNAVGKVRDERLFGEAAETGVVVEGPARVGGLTFVVAMYGGFEAGRGKNVLN